jgi:hypothetical protein
VTSGTLLNDWRVEAMAWREVTVSVGPFVAEPDQNGEIRRR